MSTAEQLRAQIQALKAQRAAIRLPAASGATRAEFNALTLRKRELKSDIRRAEVQLALLTDRAADAGGDGAPVADADVDVLGDRLRQLSLEAQREQERADREMRERRAAERRYTLLLERQRQAASLDIASLEALQRALEDEAAQDRERASAAQNDALARDLRALAGALDGRSREVAQELASRAQRGADAQRDESAGDAERARAAREALERAQAEELRRQQEEAARFERAALDEAAQQARQLTLEAPIAASSKFRVTWLADNNKSTVKFSPAGFARALVGDNQTEAAHDFAYFENNVLYFHVDGARLVKLIEALLRQFLTANYASDPSKKVQFEIWTKTIEPMLYVIAYAIEEALRADPSSAALGAARRFMRSVATWLFIKLLTGREAIVPDRAAYRLQEDRERNAQVARWLSAPADSEERRNLLFGDVAAFRSSPHGEASIGAAGDAVRGNQLRPDAKVNPNTGEATVFTPLLEAIGNEKVFRPVTAEQRAILDAIAAPPGRARLPANLPAEQRAAIDALSRDTSISLQAVLEATASEAAFGANVRNMMVYGQELERVFMLNIFRLYAGDRALEIDFGEQWQDQYGVLGALTSDFVATTTEGKIAYNVPNAVTSEQIEGDRSRVAAVADAVAPPEPPQPLFGIGGTADKTIDLARPALLDANDAFVVGALAAELANVDFKARDQWNLSQPQRRVLLAALAARTVFPPVRLAPADPSSQAYIARYGVRPRFEPAVDQLDAASATVKTASRAQKKKSKKTRASAAAAKGAFPAELRLPESDVVQEGAVFDALRPRLSTQLKKSKEAAKYTRWLTAAQLPDLNATTTLQKIDAAAGKELPLTVLVPSNRAWDRYASTGNEETQRRTAAYAVIVGELDLERLPDVYDTYTTIEGDSVTLRGMGRDARGRALIEINESGPLTLLTAASGAGRFERRARGGGRFYVVDGIGLPSTAEFREAIRQTVPPDARRADTTPLVTVLKDTDGDGDADEQVRQRNTLVQNLPPPPITDEPMTRSAASVFYVRDDGLATDSETSSSSATSEGEEANPLRRDSFTDSSDSDSDIARDPARSREMRNLEALLERAGLVAALRQAAQTQELTVFAPTGAAQLAASGLLNSLSGAQLAEAVKYHVVPGRQLNRFAVNNAAEAGRAFTTLTGERLEARLGQGAERGALYTGDLAARATEYFDEARRVLVVFIDRVLLAPLGMARAGAHMDGAQTLRYSRVQFAGAADFDEFLRRFALERGDVPYEWRTKKRAPEFAWRSDALTVTADNTPLGSARSEWLDVKVVARNARALERLRRFLDERAGGESGGALVLTSGDHMRRNSGMYELEYDEISFPSTDAFARFLNRFGLERRDARRDDELFVWSSGCGLEAAARSNPLAGTYFDRDVQVADFDLTRDWLGVRMVARDMGVLRAVQEYVETTGSVRTRGQSRICEASAGVTQSGIFFDASEESSASADEDAPLEPARRSERDRNRGALETLLRATGLAPTLLAEARRTPLTVFVPTREAQRAARRTLQSLSSAELRDAVKYHVVRGEYSVDEVAALAARGNAALATLEDCSALLAVRAGGGPPTAGVLYTGSVERGASTLFESVAAAARADRRTITLHYIDTLLSADRNVTLAARGALRVDNADTDAADDSSTLTSDDDNRRPATPVQPRYSVFDYGPFAAINRLFTNARAADDCAAPLAELGKALRTAPAEKRAALHRDAKNALLLNTKLAAEHKRPTLEKLAALATH